jgi:hypothetical protein
MLDTNLFAGIDGIFVRRTSSASWPAFLSCSRWPSAGTAARSLSPSGSAFTAFVGLNLLQSGFTGFCPPEKLLAKMGFKRGGGSCGV